jgi:hypothetical protein
MKRTGFARSKLSVSAGARNVPLARSGFLDRNTPVRAFREELRRSSRVRDRSYLSWLHSQSCCAGDLVRDVLDRCGGGIEADHVGARGLGQKSSDSESLSLCSRHHSDRHNLLGVFRGWDRERMHAFFAKHLTRLRRAYERETRDRFSTF